MKNILVTGGTSYIGKHVIAQLIEKDYSVRTTVRDKSKSVEIKSDIEKHLGKEVSLDFHLADLLKDDGWDEDKEIYVDFILKSNSIIDIQYG